MQRVTRFFMAALFLAFAILQLNDPDPMLWTALYLLPSGLSLWQGAGPWVLRAGLAYAALAAYWCFWGSDGPSCGEMFGKISWPEWIGHEATRETLGLAICAAWLLGLAFWMRKSGQSSLQGEGL